MIVSSGSTAGERNLQVHSAAKLRSTVNAVGEFVSIGEFFSHAPPSLAGTPLFRAPDPGGSGRIHVKRIVAAADRAGLKHVETGDLESVVVTRHEIPIAEALVLGTLHNALATAFGVAANERLDVDEIRFRPARLPFAQESLALALAGLQIDARSGSFRAVLEAAGSVPEHAMQINVSGQANVLIPVVKAIRRLPRGSVLTPTDIQLAYIPRRKLPHDAVREPEAVMGMAVTLDTPLGTTLLASRLHQPLLVRRNDTVTVSVTRGALYVAMRARAMTNGAMGDTVSVVNPRSHETFDAVVVGEKALEVR